MKIYNLTHNAQTVFSGSEQGCFFELQKRQSHSADHAIKYEGWKVTGQEVSEEEGKQILAADRWSETRATLAEDFNHNRQWVKIILADGTEAQGNRNAMRYSGTTKGSKVIIMQGFICKD